MIFVLVMRKMLSSGWMRKLKLTKNSSVPWQVEQVVEILRLSCPELLVVRRMMTSALVLRGRLRFVLRLRNTLRVFLAEPRLSFLALVPRTPSIAWLIREPLSRSIPKPLMET
ncbi:MAG: hypothetical protein GY872_08500 [Roseibacillus sp.]|nr:hypothetical protein [Roseibacillus sp.]